MKGSHIGNHIGVRRPVHPPRARGAILKHHLWKQVPCLHVKLYHKPQSPLQVIRQETWTIEAMATLTLDLGASCDRWRFKRHLKCLHILLPQVLSTRSPTNHPSHSLNPQHRLQEIQSRLGLYSVLAGCDGPIGKGITVRLHLFQRNCPTCRLDSRQIRLE